MHFDKNPKSQTANPKKISDGQFAGIWILELSLAFVILSRDERLPKCVG
jgi:hypothetical protein